MASHFRRFASGKRRNEIRLRTPYWVRQSDVEPIYVLAKKMSDSTGLKYDVDHIIPVNGEFVTGLHVPGNLAITLAEENNRKANSYRYWWE